MKPVARIQAFAALLRQDSPTVVVDIGANPFAGAPPYGTLRRSDRAQIIGFEPLPAALAALQAQARHNDTFLPYAVGAGGAAKLYVTRNSGLVSTLRPRSDIGALLGPWWDRATEIVQTLDIETQRLDDIAEIGRIDFLKIDIQGGELAVFQNGRAKLQSCAVIQTEVCLHPYYQDQPSFGDVQSELGAQGFIAHRFTETSAHMMGHGVKLPKDYALRGSQLTIADVVFLKDPSRMDTLDSAMIKHMALLGFAVLRSFDLCLRCLGELARRGEIAQADIETALALIAKS
jgi:FkbM family methyltransferase